MQVQKIQHNQTFRNSTQPQTSKEKKKPEFIDKFIGVVQNQDDVNDCVAVPRGIFKAYLWIMLGFGLIGIGNSLPAKMGKAKMALGIIGNCCNILSAFYFAKPFAFKGVSPTVKTEEHNTRGKEYNKTV